MGYVDIRRPREERDPRKPAGLRHHAVNNPHLFLATGFFPGLLSSSVFYIGINSLQDPFTALLLAIAAVTLLGYVSWLLLRQSPVSTRPRLGGEK